MSARRKMEPGLHLRFVFLLKRPLRVFLVEKQSASIAGLPFSTDGQQYKTVLAETATRSCNIQVKPLGSKRAGAAWPEFLFAFAIILILVSIVIPIIIEVKTRAKSVQAYSEIRLLVEAAVAYNREYREWPVYNPPERGDARYGERVPNRGVYNILAGIDGPGNVAHIRNPNRINFIRLAGLEHVQLRQNEAGEVVDPWGSPYQMAFDSNYDNIVTIANSTYGSVVGEGILVWSLGPDRKNESMHDLLSWRR